MSATLSAPGPVRVLTISSPACTRPSREHPQVKSGPVVADQQRGQLRLAEPQANPVAGHPGLGDLELGLPDPVPVADAHLVVGQAVDSEVLAELAVA